MALLITSLILGTTCNCIWYVHASKKERLQVRRAPDTFKSSRRPEGPARHLDASRQKLTPHCLVAIFDSQLPSPKLSLQMPPKLPLPTREGFFFFQNCPRREGKCAAIERQKLSRGNFCLAASRCLSRPSGHVMRAILSVRPTRSAENSLINLARRRLAN